MKEIKVPKCYSYLKLIVQAHFQVDFFHNINPIQDGSFRGCSWIVVVVGGGEGQASKKPSPSFKSVTHILQWWNLPYLKKIHKIYKSRDTLLEFCWNQHFLPEINRFCYIKKNRYRLHFHTQFLILVTIFESLNIFLIKMVTILMMSAKTVTLGLPNYKGILK